MTREERELCAGLLRTPFHPAGRISEEEFLHRFPKSIEQGKLALGLLEEANSAKSAEDLEAALMIGFTFGFRREHADVICRILQLDWHFSHEDLVSVLDDFRTIDAVEALFHATQWIPEYLDFDDNRALATKAIWALGNITGDSAEEKLKLLAGSDDPILSTGAAYQLKRRRKGL